MRIQGFWVRDSDPMTKTASYADLQMERGSKKLSQSMSISLDTPWRTDFRFQGNETEVQMTFSISRT